MSTIRRGRLVEGKARGRGCTSTYGSGIPGVARNGTMAKKKQDDDLEFELTDEDWEVIDSVVKPKKMSLETALRSTDPLGNINNNLAGTSEAQKTFRLLYASILEVNSAGVSMLFDRFSKREIETIYSRFEELNAQRLCRAIDAVRQAIEVQFGPRPSRRQVREFLDSSPPEIRCLDADRKIVEEMEASLLAHTARSLQDLKD
jgi:hypothetical protein